ncbi:MAG: hypothetical protein GEU75_04795 [Dehalococcoidia bacterium]|nr:hypothetical protein [Dehalococcoidia bacterium]
MNEGNPQPVVSARLSRLPKTIKLAVLALAPIVLVIAGYFGMVSYPDASAPTAAEAARNIAATFHIPENADQVLVGDYLIERFYILDVETGQRKAGDICKGRVKDIVVTMAGDWSGFDYRVVLDRTGLEGERDRIKAFVGTLAPVDPALNAEYVGLWVQGGPGGVFLLNYSGKLPEGHTRFSPPEDGGDVYSFLQVQDYAEVSKRLRLLNVDGTNFLLRSTAEAAYYRETFGTQKAVMLVELLVVDGTSPSQVSTYREISWNTPHR